MVSKLLHSELPSRTANSQLPTKKCAAARKGFNLIEAAIVLGVIGLIIGGIWVASSSIQEKNRQQEFLRQITYIIDKTSSQFRNMTIPSVDEPIVVNSGTPAALRTALLPPSSTNMTSPWGQGFQLQIYNGYINIQYYRIPLQTCISLAPRIASALRGSLMSFGTYSVSIDSSTYGSVSGDTPSLANTNCKDALDADTEIGISFNVTY